MKKIYKEPKMKVVRVSHRQMLCVSPGEEDPDVEQIEITEEEEEGLPPV